MLSRLSVLTQIELLSFRRLTENTRSSTKVITMASRLKLVAVLSLLVGCDGPYQPNPPVRATTTFVAAEQSEAKPDGKRSMQVLAQGRIQPERGIIRLSALPGDRIDELSVSVGQSVQKGAAIATLQSFQIKSIELDAAMLKLDEAKSQLEAKRKEADLAIDGASLKLQSAKQLLIQATAQKELAAKGNDQVEFLNKQISTLSKLRDDPLTRAAIGTIELESKKSDLVRVSAMNDQTTLAAKHAFELGQFQVEQAERSQRASIESKALIEKSASTASLEKQIDLLRAQVQQGKIVSPIDGFVLSINAEVGERTAQFPIAEIADLSRMSCVAEVHESEVSRLSIGDRVEMRSSALNKIVIGHIDRIDRVVGAVQMRSPNPMARSDFRAVPVWIAIDKEDTEVASSRLQLQVEVAISCIR
jgi:HlyD family secretion protein